MKEPALIEPAAEYEAEYLAMLAEWRATGEKLTPFVLKMDPSDFPGLVAKLKRYSRGEGIPASFVPHETYWLVDEDRRILGVVNIRPRLNESLMVRGGHIGYGVRPSERGKGCATEMLRLALEKTKAMGLERVLLTCDKENTASARVIVKNGGVLESEIHLDGAIVQRYWIELHPPRAAAERKSIDAIVPSE
ncbi:MAG: GNAT family N-acetyltransferase [Patescibacteria group bacterium]